MEFWREKTRLKAIVVFIADEESNESIKVNAKSFKNLLKIGANLLKPWRQNSNQCIWSKVSLKIMQKFPKWALSGVF